MIPGSEIVEPGHYRYFEMVGGAPEVVVVYRRAAAFLAARPGFADCPVGEMPGLFQGPADKPSDP